jgi:hypothetical protein
MEDVDNLDVKGLFSSYHLRSNFEASHSLASSTCPASPLVSSPGNVGNHKPSNEENQKGGISPNHHLF